MISRFLLYALLLLLGWKLVARLSFREIGRRIDRVVNATLLAIVIVYSLEIAYWLVTK